MLRHLYSFYAFLGIINSSSVSSLTYCFVNYFSNFYSFSCYRHPLSSFRGFNVEGFFLYPATPICFIRSSAFFSLVDFLFLSLFYL
jgi:hypothetical protein